MHGAEEQTVRLKAPLPVYLGYWTARAERDGRVGFWKDVYGIDSRQSAALSERVDRLRHGALAAAAVVRPAVCTLTAR